MDIKTEIKKEFKSELPSQIKTRNGLQSTDCIKTLIVLRQQEHIIEKSLNALITNMKTIPEYGDNLRYEQLQLSSTRTKLCNSLTKTMFDIANELKSVKSIVQNLQNIDIDDYKSKLQSLWKKMEKFNKSDFLEILGKQENVIDSELNEFCDTLQEYEKSYISTNKYPTCNIKNKKSNQGCESYDNVQDFCSLVSKTGHTENWSQEDHLLFLKMRKKCKGIPSLVIAMQNKCPDLSTECIVNHEAWYKIYLELRQKQKESVNEWRKKKETERIEKMKKHNDSLGTHKNTNYEVQDNFNKTIEIDLIKPVTKNITHAREINKEAEKKKELIKRWKIERENQRLNDEEETQLQFQMKQEKEKQRQARAMKIKMDLAKYKEAKLKETELLKMNANNTKKYTTQSKNLMQTFRQQNERYIEKRKFLLQKKLHRNQVSMNRRRTLFYPRNSTLFKSTKVWEEKCRIENSMKREPTRLMYIKDLPRMNTSYRRNLESF